MEVPDNEWRASTTGWECRKRGAENEREVKQRAGTLAIGVGTPKNELKLIRAQHEKKNQADGVSRDSYPGFPRNGPKQSGPFGTVWVARDGPVGSLVLVAAGKL